MKRHLNKLKKCSKDLESYNYSDDEIMKLSLNIVTPEIKNNLECIYCNKIFTRSDNLNRHKEKYCKNKTFNQLPEKSNTNNIDSIDNNDKKESNVNIQNIEKQVNIDKQINVDKQINIDKQVNNYIIIDNKHIQLKGFDDEWNIEHLDNYLKLLLLLSKTKYTDFLSEVLKNHDNLNVILDKESESGLVYKNNSDMYVKLTINEILNNSMRKIYEHIQKMYDEYLCKDSNKSLNIEKHFLESIEKEKNISNTKYDNYVNDNTLQKNVNDILIDIFNKNKDDALKIAQTINNVEKLGY
jgi:hypothetical protein